MVGMTGMGFAPVNPMQNNPMDMLRENYEKRQMIRQEMRRKDLEEKAQEGDLSNMEAMELKGYRIQDGLEKLAQIATPKVCYMA